MYDCRACFGVMCLGSVGVCVVLDVRECFFLMALYMAVWMAVSGVVLIWNAMFELGVPRLRFAVRLVVDLMVMVGFRVPSDALNMRFSSLGMSCLMVGVCCLCVLMLMVIFFLVVGSGFQSGVWLMREMMADAACFLCSGVASDALSMMRSCAMRASWGLPFFCIWRA